jgi:hypothetical protein
MPEYLYKNIPLTPNVARHHILSTCLLIRLRSETNLRSTQRISTEILPVKAVVIPRVARALDSRFRERFRGNDGMYAVRSSL